MLLLTLWLKSFLPSVQLCVAATLNKNKPPPPLFPPYIASLLFFYQEGGQSSVTAVC